MWRHCVARTCVTSHHHSLPTPPLRNRPVTLFVRDGHSSSGRTHQPPSAVTTTNKNLHVCTIHQQYQSPFIIPTDAHNYKIIGMLKTIKILTVAPTCFGSRRNHHQGAISCLAKTTIMILLCSSLLTWSVSWRHISLLCACTTG